MKKNTFIFSLIFIILFSSSLQQDEFNIPSKYISDSAFISMLTQEPTPSKTLYASPSGSGSSCSKSSPCPLETAVKNLEKGTTLYLKGGTYTLKSGITLSKSGTSKAYIVISSAPNEKAILTSTKSDTVHLFQVSGSYIIIENLTFQNVSAKLVQGIVFYGGGQHHIIIRNNLFDKLKTTVNKEGANGILLMGESSTGIKQVIIYGNTLTNNVLGYHEALSIAGNCEEIYVLQNTLKNNTNIGIDFYGNAKYCKTPELDQPRKSVAIKNYIEKSNSPNADCAGLYVDGARDIYLAENKIISSQYGIEIGSEERNDDYPVKNIIVKDNVVTDNTVNGIRVGGYEKKETGYVQDCTISGNKISGSDNAIHVAKAKNIVFDSNQITGANEFFINMEFDSSYTKNIEIENNIFSGKGKFRLYETTIMTLDEFIAKYPSNKKK